MVESAFEFADICRKHDYHNFVFSMKASNPLVMVQAYRLLAEEMYVKGWDYPLHLGVTGMFMNVLQLLVYKTADGRAPYIDMVGLSSKSINMCQSACPTTHEQLD